MSYIHRNKANSLGKNNCTQIHILIFNYSTLNFYLILCMGVLPAFMSIHHMVAWYTWRPEYAVRLPGSGVSDG